MEIPQDPATPKAGFFTKIMIWIAGADEETLKRCPPKDWDNVRAVAVIMIFTMLYQSALFAVIGHRLFAAPGEIRPEIIAVSFFIGSFVLVLDSYTVMRAGWVASGVALLKLGGLDVSGGPVARLKAGGFLAIRILLSVGIAQLTAIFFGLIVFGPDIDAQIQTKYLRANAHLVADATTLVDGDIHRATDAVKAEGKKVDEMSKQVEALRQNLIDPSAHDPQVEQAQQEIAQLLAQKSKADDAVQRAETFATNELGGLKGVPGNSGQPGNGPRHAAAVEQLANARSRAQQAGVALEAARGRLDTLRKQLVATGASTQQQSRQQLPAFEAMLASEEVRHSGLKAQLADLTRNRGDAIRTAVEKAPDHVARDSGFLAQIAALETLAQSDHQILAVILLIDFVSFGFELAGVLSKVTSFIPTTYSALLASDAYMQAVRIVGQMVGEMNGSVDEGTISLGPPPKPTAANDNEPIADASDVDLFDEQDDEGPPQPPRRPRGRPPKAQSSSNG